MNSSTPPRVSSGRWTKLASVVCAAAAAAVVVHLATKQGTGQAVDAAPAAKAAAVQPAAPAARQLQLVHAETFQVNQPFKHLWRKDQPFVNHGWLLVLSGDAELLRVQQVKMPVLFVGAQTADRVNTGEGSGHIVVIVPGDFALADAPIFFGGVGLPEETTPAVIAAELANARAAGALPPTADAIAAASKVAGQTFATDFELRLRAIDLVEQYSPGETDLIAGWRVPRVR